MISALLATALATLPVPSHVMPLVRVEGGSFVAGSAEASAYAPPVAATVKGFWLGRFEVTVGQWAAFVNARGGKGHPQLGWRRGRWVPRPGEARRPVAWVSVEDARAFAAWFGERHGVTARLPTETEWEWAARAGERVRYPWGWGPPTPRLARLDAEGPAPVGRHAPNPWGLHDMAGNVWEWCEVSRPPVRPGQAVARGGSWAEPHPHMVTIHARGWFRPDYRDADVGFRLLIEAAP